MAEPAISPQTLPLSEWSNLLLYVYWAYAGPPIERHRWAGHTPASSAWLLLDGHVSVTFGRHTHSAAAGQWVFLPPGAVGYDFSDDSRILSIHYSARWTNGRLLFDHDSPLVFAADDYPYLGNAGWALHRQVNRRCPGAANRLRYMPVDLQTHLALQVSTHQWLAAVSRVMAALGHRPGQIAPLDPRVSAARRIIHARTPAEPFVERALPQRLGISPSHLDRLFVRELGETVRSYAERCRVEWARRAIGAGEMSVKQVALQLGFKQASHFTHWFRKHTGHTPTAYRRRPQDVTAPAGEA